MAEILEKAPELKGLVNVKDGIVFIGDPKEIPSDRIIAQIKAKIENKPSKRGVTVETIEIEAEK